MESLSNEELANLVLTHINRITFLNLNSLNAELARRTASEAADYIIARMQAAISFDDRLQLLTFAMGKAPIDGLILEFGVHAGETVNHIAAFFERRPVYGFDSFHGLKEDWRGHHNMAAGSFDLGGALPTVNGNVHLVKGWFDQSLPPFFIQSANTRIAFMHVDSDTYEAAKVIFDNAQKCLTIGSIIVFDEYLNYRGWRIGEYKAWQDACAAWGLEYEYLGFCIHGEQVAVRVTRVANGT